MNEWHIDAQGYFCPYFLGLLYLHGPEYKLNHLSLHSNQLDSIDHLLQCLLGLHSLKEVILSKDGADNPLCRSPGMTLQQRILFSNIMKCNAPNLVTLVGQ